MGTEITALEKCQHPFQRWKVDGQVISDFANLRLLMMGS
jgi:hypothetical protein